MFRQLSETSGCDKKLAERYRYEAEHFAVMCGDALTLHEMDNLAQTYQETGDAELLKKIAAAARKQKEARLSHIADLEKIKEPFLIPSHSRIQCAPMQYFADIEAYLTTTPAEDLKLDFADMRHAASELFRSLF